MLSKTTMEKGIISTEIIRDRRLTAAIAKCDKNAKETTTVNLNITGFYLNNTNSQSTSYHIVQSLWAYTHHVTEDVIKKSFEVTGVYPLDPAMVLMRCSGALPEGTIIPGSGPIELQPSAVYTNKRSQSNGNSTPRQRHTKRRKLAEDMVRDIEEDLNDVVSEVSQNTQHLTPVKKMQTLITRLESLISEKRKEANEIMAAAPPETLNFDDVLSVPIETTSSTLPEGHLKASYPVGLKPAEASSVFSTALSVKASQDTAKGNKARKKVICVGITKTATRK